MPQSFVLSPGESLQVLSVPPTQGQQAFLVYRISVHTLKSDCELKIVRDGVPALVISSKQKHKVVDVAVLGNLYIEGAGEKKDGVVAGNYECVARD